MSGNTKQNDATEGGKVECGNKKAGSYLPICSPTVRNVTHPLRYYEFTQEELKALEECDKESFYQRCLPFSTLFAVTTYAAVKYGFLKKNPHLGAFPKMLLAFFIGHFYGRYAYIPHCEEKLRRLPANSHLGAVMRNYHSERLKSEH